MSTPESRKSSSPKPVAHSARIQITYKGVGRIRKRIAGADAAKVARIESALDEFFRANNLTVLRQVKNGDLTPEEALELLLARGANASTAGNGHKNLITELDSWLDSHDVKPATKRSYKSHLVQLKKRISNAQTVSDLPSVLRGYRQVCQDSQALRSFNITRDTVRAFAKATAGKNSSLYADIEAIPAFRRLQPKRPRRALEVMEVATLLDLLPEHHALQVLSICLTGMRPSEYFMEDEAEWFESDTAVRVDGAKTKNSRRLLFKMPGVTKPVTGKLALSRAIGAALKDPAAKDLPEISTRSFRKTFRHWCSEAGIPDARISVYGGWSAQSMLELYGEHDAERYMAEDKQKLEDYMRAKMLEIAEDLPPAKMAPHVWRFLYTQPRSASPET